MFTIHIVLAPQLKYGYYHWYHLVILFQQHVRLLIAYLQRHNCWCYYRKIIKYYHSISNGKFTLLFAWHTFILLMIMFSKQRLGCFLHVDITNQWRHQIHGVRKNVTNNLQYLENSTTQTHSYHERGTGKVIRALLNGDIIDDLKWPQSAKLTHIFTFWVLLHICGMAKVTVFKFCTQVGHIKY